MQIKRTSVSIGSQMAATTTLENGFLTVETDKKTFEQYFNPIVILSFFYFVSGQERYRAITSAYYRGALGAVLVYDIAKGTSFLNLDKWVQELRQHANDDLSVILVGNKQDLKHLRMIEGRRGKQFAADHGMLFIETSALDSTNVSEAFEFIFRHIYDKVKLKEQEKTGQLLEQSNGSLDIIKPVELKPEAQTNEARPAKQPCCTTV